MGKQYKLPNLWCKSV